MPIDYSKYPPNWKSEIRPAILRRAGNRCEQCGVSNGAIGYRDETGRFFEIHPNPSPGAEQMPRFKLIRIVLTVAHFNHDVADSSPLNLAALCQKCHLTHDAGQHKATRQKNRFRNQPELFSAKQIIAPVAKIAGVTDQELTEALMLFGSKPTGIKVFNEKLRELITPTEEATKEAVPESAGTV